mmetsp:Transcript_50151/g.114147  ORF Transcript_50151/g.114147 Transcript_50151/m.114147 type:complete len:210 (-) Transcript_50151:165-794(-)
MVSSSSSSPASNSYSTSPWASASSNSIWRSRSLVTAASRASMRPTWPLATLVMSNPCPLQLSAIHLWRAARASAARRRLVCRSAEASSRPWCPRATLAIWSAAPASRARRTDASIFTISFSCRKSVTRFATCFLPLLPLASACARTMSLPLSVSTIPIALATAAFPSSEYPSAAASMRMCVAEVKSSCRSSDFTERCTSDGIDMTITDV